MRITRYGITLQPLQANQLEQVRLWRNSDRIRLQMEYQEIITPDQQLDWFNALDRHKQFYFMLWLENEPAGLVHLKDLDQKAQTAESGIFVGEERFLNTTWPLLAVLALNDLAFCFFGLHTLQAKVSAYNLPNQQFNEKLGFVQASTTPGFIRYTLSRTHYFADKNGLRKTAVRTYGPHTHFHPHPSSDSHLGPFWAKCDQACIQPQFD